MKSLCLWFTAGLLVAGPGCAWLRPTEGSPPPALAPEVRPTTNWMNPPTNGNKWSDNKAEREKREKNRP